MNHDGFEMERDVPLAPRTTLELGGAAELFCEAKSREELWQALAWAARHAVPVTLLGGGSNVLVPDAGVAGLVVVPAFRGIHHDAQAPGVLDVEAGEPWDALVAHTVAERLAGLECLSGIPGSTGATPIQNVGAYGVEVGERVEFVTVLDRVSLESTRIPAAACGFAYRHSRFKEDPERFVVLGVRFRLDPGGAPALRYAELVRAVPEDADVATVRQTVLALRRGKSMVIDPADENRRSVGSFFTNPIVPVEDAERVVALAVARGMVERPEQVPRWPSGSEVKLAAGWLIEKAGVARGERRGHVGVSSRHALCLVHHGGGTTAELLDFANEIARRVEVEFGIRLSREPVELSARRPSHP